LKFSEEMMAPGDLVKLVATIPPAQAFRPLDRSKRSVVK
jgi:hypothetical protein